MKQILKPVVLIVLDGFGLSLEKQGNPIMAASTPNFDDIGQYYPGSVLQASGMEVGLRWGDMGNSEVGHGNIGAGQVVFQNLTRIDIAIEDGSFHTNPIWKHVTNHAVAHTSTIHLIGLVSNGGIHSHIDHLVNTVQSLRLSYQKDIILHFITDGQDTAPQSAKQFKDLLFERLENPLYLKIATVCGRYYAMDKNENWERTQKAYECFTAGVGLHAKDFESALSNSYLLGLFDEVLPPTVIVSDDGTPFSRICDGDAVIFFNFRADRVRQLTQAFVFEPFTKFARERIKNLLLVSMVSYGSEYTTLSAFPAQQIVEPLAAVIAASGRQQLHIAETEKYAHITYFFNGGVEERFPGEDRILVQSPKVASYDLAPEMGAFEITEKAVSAISLGHYDFILINYANGDMVGHTGNFQAGVKAVEVLDACVGNVVGAALAAGGAVLITADHGNVEEMLNMETLVIDKEHSTNPVPFWVITPDNRRAVAAGHLQDLVAQAVLADVAPTVLEIMDLAKPAHMTGMSLYGLMGSCALPKEK